VREFARELVTGVRDLVLLLFNELHRAGIFPVSRLIASLPILIDTGIRLVLTYIQPLLTWVSWLVEALLTWLGEFISRLGVWLQGVLNALPVFLRDLIGYLIETALRPALRIILVNDIRPAVGLIVKDAIRALVEGLTTVFVGFLAGLGTVIIETLKWGGDWIAYAIVKVLNKLPGVDIDYAEPQPLGERLRQGLKEAFLRQPRPQARPPVRPLHRAFACPASVHLGCSYLRRRPCQSLPFPAMPIFPSSRFNTRRVAPPVRCPFGACRCPLRPLGAGSIATPASRPPICWRCNTSAARNCTGT
jgi:hypothetical protein